MSEMKLIMESWNKFIVNEEQNNWVTWRMLSDAIDLIAAEKKGEETKERQQKLLNLGGKSLLKLAASLLTGPIGAMVTSGLDSKDVIGGMIKAYSRADDSKTNQNPFLDLFNLDDGFQDLIDDNLEDRFVQKMMDDISGHIEQNPDQTIPDFDKVIQTWLPTLDLSGTTDNNVTKTEPGQ